jgi:hypothetical protein
MTVIPFVTVELSRRSPVAMLVTGTSGPDGACAADGARATDGGRKADGRCTVDGTRGAHGA